MNKALILFYLALSALSAVLSSQAHADTEYVQGHFTRTNHYVAPYYRTTRDDTTVNNFNTLPQGAPTVVTPDSNTVNQQMNTWNDSGV